MVLDFREPFVGDILKRRGTDHTETHEEHIRLQHTRHHNYTTDPSDNIKRWFLKLEFPISKFQNIDTYMQIN